MKVINWRASVLSFVSALGLASCATPAKAVKVTYQDHFSPQQFRYFKASTLAVYKQNHSDAAALKIMSQQLYQHSYSYPTYAYFYFPHTLVHTFGAKLTAQMRSEAAAHNDFSVPTQKALQAHHAPFRYIAWARIHSNKTYRKQIDDDKNCQPGWFGEQSCSSSNSFNSYRKIELQANIYDIQRSKVIWRANITALRDHVYYSALSGLLGSALSHMFDSKLPYPVYPTTSETLNSAFAAMGSNVYDGKNVLQISKKRYKE